jgi:hypothetical protein
VSLLDHPKSINQLCDLERRTGKGRDSIDHPPNGHDDIANALAGAAVNVQSGSSTGSMPHGDFFALLRGGMSADTEMWRDRLKAEGRYYG